MALHDKIKEKRGKTKQQATDKGQNDEIRQLREQVKQLESRGRGREEKSDDKDKKTKNSRSRSSSTTSYRSGRWHRRRGDSLERALDKEADIVRVQQEVNNVLQDALAKRPNMAQADLNKLVTAAQLAAKEGSVDKLRGHYDRLLATTNDAVANVANEQAAPTKGIPPPDALRPRITDNIMPPPTRQASRAPSQAPSRAGSRHDSAQDDVAPLKPKTEAGKSRADAGNVRPESRKAVPIPIPVPVPIENPTAEENQRPRPVYADPFAQLPGPEESERLSTKSNVGRGTRASYAGDGESPRTSRAVYSDPFKDPLPAPTKRTKSVYGDFPRQAPRSEWHPTTGTHTAKSVAPEKSRQEAKAERGNSSGKNEAGISQLLQSAWMPPGRPVPEASKAKSKAPTVAQLPSKPQTDAGKSQAKSLSVKTEAPKSRVSGVVPVPNDPAPLGSKAIIDTSSKEKTKENGRSADHFPRSGSKSSNGKRPMKALPPPPNDLFCRYAQDLQASQLPLHPNFKHSGSHRCPHCLVTIPVDTRDVWVLSTHFPKSKSSSPSSNSKTRDYRMDARFVAKCHTTAGEYACVLCDRYRDMDCLCRSVDALVKHLGTAHTPDEFEGDGDLVRMRENGSGDKTVRGRSGEMALA